jgi:hypothetical protein
MTQVDDLSRSLTTFEQNSTMVVVLVRAARPHSAGVALPALPEGKRTGAMERLDADGHPIARL